MDHLEFSKDQHSELSDIESSSADKSKEEMEETVSEMEGGRKGSEAEIETKRDRRRAKRIWGPRATQDKGSLQNYISKQRQVSSSTRKDD